MSEKVLVGKKGKERWYPQYAPHYILGTDISMLDILDTDISFLDFMNYTLVKRQI